MNLELTGGTSQVFIFFAISNSSVFESVSAKTDNLRTESGKQTIQHPGKKEWRMMNTFFRFVLFHYIKFLHPTKIIILLSRSICFIHRRLRIIKSAKWKGKELKCLDQPYSS